MNDARSWMYAALVTGLLILGLLADGYDRQVIQPRDRQPVMMECGR